MHDSDSGIGIDSEISPIYAGIGIGIRDFKCAGIGTGIGIIDLSPGIGVESENLAWNRNWTQEFKKMPESESESRHTWNRASLKSTITLTLLIFWIPSDKSCLQVGFHFLACNNFRQTE